MAEQLDIVAFHALRITTFFEGEIKKDQTDLMRPIEVGSAKQLVQSKEQSRTILRTQERLDNFKATGQALSNAEIIEEEKDEIDPSDSSSSTVSAAPTAGGVETSGETTAGVGVSVEIGGRNAGGSTVKPPIVTNGWGKSKYKTKQDIKDAFTKINEDFASKFDFENRYAAWAAQYKDDLEVEEGSRRLGELIKDQFDNSHLGRGEYKEALKQSIEECIPCLERIKFLGELDLFGSIIEALEADYKARLEQLLRMFEMLFQMPEDFDLCRLIKFLSFMCIPDLYAIIALLMQYYSALILNSIGLVGDLTSALMALISLILSPVLLGVNGMMDAFIDMVLAPINCIIDSIREQLRKIPNPSISGGATFQGNNGETTELGSISRLNIDSIDEFQNELNKAFDNVSFSSKEVNKRVAEDLQDPSQFRKHAHDLMSGGRVNGRDGAVEDGVLTQIGGFLGLLLETVVFAREYANQKIEELRRLLNGVLSQINGAGDDISRLLKLGRDIAFFVGLILLIIKLIKNKGLYCDGSEDDLQEIVNSINASGDPVFNNIVLREREDDLPSEQQGDYVFVPLAFADEDLKIADGQLIVEPEIPGFGTIKIPAQIVRSCESAIRFESDEKVKKWMTDLLNKR